MIIASTAMKDVLKEMEVVDCFNVSMNVPSLRLRQEITHILNDYKCSSQVCDKISQELVSIMDPKGIPIKNMLLSIDLALHKSGGKQIDYDHFMEAYYFVTQTI